MDPVEYLSFLERLLEVIIPKKAPLGCKLPEIAKEVFNIIGVREGGYIKNIVMSAATMAREQKSKKIKLEHFIKAAKEQFPSANRSVGFRQK